MTRSRRSRVKQERTSRVRPATRCRNERGSAIADFVFAMVVLLPIFAGVLQLALVLHVRNTVTAAASEGARYAATVDGSIEGGEARTRDHITESLQASYANGVSGRIVNINGQQGVEITVTTRVPALGLGGPAIEFTVHGTAVKESAPTGGAP